MSKLSKVLVIGSGPIIIGQAAEFDYAGTQACKALREEGVTSILVNSNPATIMTDEGIADIVYIEPLTVDVLARIIERERPDGLLPTLGGQTGLNLAVALDEAGVLDKYGVRALGTPLAAIRQAEDRRLFKEMLTTIGEPVPRSVTVTSVEEAHRFADGVGLPLVIRPAYTLGGTGGGIATSREDLERVVEGGLAASPIHQVLVEESVMGWKEVEYEVMRDGADNCITVCNMENMDPMGVHTGDSIVVAPSQTLSDKEYQMLRSASLRIIRALGIEGGCNIQFALSPQDSRYYVIEVNPRVSRSSALASKATGYPIARVAAKIAVGKRLDQIPNAVTGKTTAAFEPALDYCVVKIPRWPFDKFAFGDRSLGTQMKSTGEVMTIERCFEAALQKAVRGLELGGKTLLWEDPRWGKGPAAEVRERLLPLIEVPNDLRLWAMMAALRRGVSVEDIAQRSGIDRWFGRSLQNIVHMEKRLLGEKLTPELLRATKRLGFSDEQIGTLADRLPEQVRALRAQWSIRPVYKMVDTCAAEFAADTPYFYSTYEVENEAEPMSGAKAVVIGSGPIRIGQGIEFDYCSVHSAWALQRAGVRAIMVNSNPETVSTDYDTSDKLYFEPLTVEDVLNIAEVERPDGVIVQFGGQTPLNLAHGLEAAGLPIIGTSPDNIDIAEDRKRFSALIERLGIRQPENGTATRVDEAVAVAERVGYPVLVRPSFVLGGRAMVIVYDRDELARYMEMAMGVSGDRPILIDRFLEDAHEFDVDVVADGQEVVIGGIMQHIENAGIHSGDSACVLPPYAVSEENLADIRRHTHALARALNVVGLMNVQYAVQNGRIYVLEVNPRASRTVPFVSKVIGVPLAKVAARAMVGKSLREQGFTQEVDIRHIAVKEAVLPFIKFPGVDTVLGPEMKSTGEVMGLDTDFGLSFLKAQLSAGVRLPERGAVFISVNDRDKPGVLDIARRLDALSFTILATSGTQRFLVGHGVKATRIPKLNEDRPHIVDAIKSNQIALMINTPLGAQSQRDDAAIRRAAVQYNVPYTTTLSGAAAAVAGMESIRTKPLRVKTLQEYHQQTS
ncbi:carbamoyl-phosphate synthase large subunit [bacterium]|nr:carbamoyl-phosphate synthase large subunit [bacterium]